MMDEIEELWALAEECRQWVRDEEQILLEQRDRINPLAIANQFARIAEKIDWIARRLAARMPT